MTRHACLLLASIAVAVAAAPATPPAPPAPAAAATPAPAAPADTDIFLADLYLEQGKVAPPVDITERDGYDNQPAFTLDGSAVLYVADGGTDDQTDVWRYDIASGESTQVTRTPQAEFSPTPLAGGGFSAVRVEAPKAEGEAYTESQHLWRYGMDGAAVAQVAAVGRVGYHAWIDANRFAAFLVGGGEAKKPHQLVLVEVDSGKVTPLAFDIGRSLGRAPDGRVSFVDKADAKAWTVSSIAPDDLKPRSLVATPPGPAGEAEGDRSEDYCWLPDGSLLMAKGKWLLRWDGKPDSGWTALAELKDLPGDIKRLAVSRDGRRLAMVVALKEPRRTRGIRG